MKKALLMLPCALLGCLLFGQTAWSQDTYKRAKDAFAKQMGQSVKRQYNDPTAMRYTNGKEGGWAKKVINGKEIDVWVGKSPRMEPIDPVPGICVIDTKPQPLNTCLKLWAELSDEKGTQTGNFVNIELYKWRPEQRLYFWVDSAVPVQMSIVQYYNVGAAEGKDPKLVSPNEKFPLTYSTTQPGRAFRFPQLFKLDKNLSDEFITLTVIRAGDTVSIPGQPTTVPPTLPINEPTTSPTVTNLQITQQNTMMNFLNAGNLLIRKNGLSYKDRSMELRRLEAVNPVGTVPTGTDMSTYSSTDPHTVAMFALGSNTLGHLPLRFRK